MASRPPFPSQQGQYAQVFPLKPAPFCTLFAGLGSTNKSASCLLLLSDFRSVLSSIFPFTLISVRNCFLSSPVLSGYNGSLDTRFFRTTTRLMSWPNGSATRSPSNPLWSLSLIPRIHFFRTGGVLFYLNSSIHRFPRFPPRNLCFYVMLAVFSLAFAATDTVFC